MLCPRVLVRSRTGARAEAAQQPRRERGGRAGIWRASRTLVWFHVFESRADRIQSRARAFWSGAGEKKGTRKKWPLAPKTWHNACSLRTAVW
eukprot:483921-Prymnesium_polylepis.1